MTAPPTRLVPATDEHFAWLLRGDGTRYEDLRQPPGGIDERSTIEHVRAIARRVARTDGCGSWLIVAAEEVVGLCGHKQPPDASGEVEIGYNVAPSRRRRGHATRAVAAMLCEARADARIAAVTAQVLVANVASERVLLANGFARDGSWVDAREGEVGRWRVTTR